MDIRNYSLEYGRTIDGVSLSDALALGRGEIDTVKRTAHSGIGETMWIADGTVRITQRHMLPNDLISLEVELTDEPNVRSRINPYAEASPRYGAARPEHVEEARRALTRRIGFVMGVEG